MGVSPFSEAPAPAPAPARHAGESPWIAIESNPFAGVAIAVALVAASALVRGILLGELGARAAFVTFYPAVAVAALFGGFRAGAIATIFSAALVDVFWIEPGGSFIPVDGADYLSLVIFFISGSIISWTAERLRRANREVRRANATLHEEVLRVGQRTAQLARATDALQTEISLRRGFEERFRAVIDSAPTAMIMVDHEGVIELVNVQAEQTFGYPRDRLLGQKIDILLPRRLRGNHVDHRGAYFAAPAQRAMGIGHELFALREDGEEFPVEIGLSPLSTPDGVKVIASVVDISQRWQMERALSESERRSRLMFDNIRDHAIIMLDAEGRVVSWNVGAERLKGYHRDEIVGRHFSLFYLAEDVADGKPERELIAAAREGSVEDQGWRLRKDGSRFMANVTLNAVKNAKGELEGFVDVTRDITERKKIEDALIEANERFAFAAEAAGLGFFGFDVETQSGSWDERMFKLYGVSRAAGDEPSALWSRSLHPEDRARAERELAESISNMRPYSTEFRIVRPDGEVRHISAAASLVRDQTTGARRIFGLNLDVTDRKKIENELIEANERFALAAEAAGLGFWDYDIATNSARWDEQMYRLYDIETESVDHFAPRLDHLHPGDRARIEDEIRDAVEGRKKFNTEYRVVLHDGRVRHIKSAASLKGDPSASALHLLGVSFDMTERKQIENELIETNERFALASEAAGLGFWDFDIDKQTARWDAYMFRLHGIPREEGEQPLEIRAGHVHPHDVERLLAELRDATTGLRSFDSEYRILWPDGRLRHLRAAASLKRDPTGRRSRLLGVSFDVTERKEAQLSLEQARDAAQAANRAKSAFLASMSHEIRTPMNGVIGFADLLLDSELTEQQRGHATRLRDASKSLLSLLNDILDLSKIEAGKLEFETIPMSLETVVNGAASIVRMQSDAKGLDLRIETDGDLPRWIASDPTRLRQILLNLLSNALKFTDHGGITVRCSRETSENADFLRFEVEDTGIGIPEDRQHLLFQDFSQVDRTTTRRYGGTGLGLSICKRLARAMGGAIGIRSVPGVGSTIWFTIALRACAAPDLSSAPDPTTAVARPSRILVVDDLEMNRDIVEAMLGRAGHSVRGVESGRRAVIAVQEGDFDLVLMDMEMPEMDGVASTRAIRRLDERVRRVPIVALTANAFLEDRERCRAAGMNDFLPKPIDGEALLAMVAKWSGGAARAIAGTPPATSLALPKEAMARR